MAQQNEVSDGAYAESLLKLQHAAAVAAYIYGAPVFELAAAEYAQLNGLDTEIQGPRGVFAHFRNGLPDHRTRWFGAPNPDVLYSSAWLHVQTEPYVIYVPPMDDVWYSVQFEDYFMNNVGYLSSRTIGRGDGFYLIAHRDWQGKLPWGVRDVIRIPTPVSWVLLRIAASRENQADIVTRYQNRFNLIRLSEYQSDPQRAQNMQSRVSQNTPMPPRAVPEMRGTIDYFSVLNFHLRRMDILESEQGLMRFLDLAGIGPGAEFNPRGLSRASRDNLQAAAQEGARIVDRMRYQPRGRTPNGWGMAPAWIGNYGQDYLLRAIAAYGGIGANNIEEAIYPNAYYDSEGRKISGNREYTISFSRGAYPPTGAFWSIAAYDVKSRQLPENAINRYGIGSNTEGLVYGEDGSLRLYLSHREPSDPVRRANWLPLPQGEVFLIARIYSPLPEALDGKYVLPAVRPALQQESLPPF